MKWGKLFGWGIAIYAAVFLAWSILVIHGFIEGLAPRALLAATLAAVLVVAGRDLRLHQWYDVLPYSIGWILIIIVFDLVCAVPVSGWEIWHDWNIWVGYLMVLLVPLLTVSPRKRHSHARAS